MLPMEQSAPKQRVKGFDTVNQFKNGVLNACAESAMMGSSIRVRSEGDAVYICGYICRTLLSLDDDAAVVYGKMIYEGATRFNLNDTPVQYITTNSTAFGNMITLVRDETLKNPDNMESLTTPDGVFAYVYNLDAPDCSELGYVFFQNKNGRVVRVG